MKFLLYLFIGLMLFSCTKLEKGDGDDLLVLNTSMRKSIKHKKVEASSQIYKNQLTMNALPGEWTMLTGNGAGYVVYYPCDADNQTISINKKDGEYFLLHGLGQDAVMFKVESFEQTSETSLILKLKALDKNLRKEVSVSWEDTSGQVTKWEGLVNSESQLNFTPLEFVDKFEKIIQPCKECWPEEDCQGK